MVSGGTCGNGGQVTASMADVLDTTCTGDSNTIIFNFICLFVVVFFVCFLNWFTISY